MALQVWSATQLNGNMTGGGTTVVTDTNSSVNNICAYGAESFTTGKFYWETAISSSSYGIGQGWGVGNTSSTTANTNYIGEDANSIGVFSAAPGLNIGINNSFPTASSDFTPASGDRIGHALDLVNNLYWTKDITQATAWYGYTGGTGAITTGNPATGSNGVSLTAASGTVNAAPVVPGICLAFSGDTGTIYAQPGQWMGAPPVGFLPFDFVVPTRIRLRTYSLTANIKH